MIFLYRPEYYGIEQWNEDYNNDSTENQAEIIIAKNRHGGTLSERVKVDLAISSFSNLICNYTTKNKTVAKKLFSKKAQINTLNTLMLMY